MMYVAMERKQVKIESVKNIKTLWLSVITLTFSLQCSGAQYPCAFIDTVNISGSYPHGPPQFNTSPMTTNTNGFPANLSYIYQWMIVPSELVAVYDFVIVNGIRVPSEKHLRACVCKLKPCIRFCCSPGFYYDLQANSCSPLPTNDTNIDQPFMEVHFSNGSTVHLNTSAHFLVHNGVPCENMRVVLKNNRQVDWLLYANGSIIHKNYIFSRNYCYSPLAWMKDKEKELENPSWHWEPLTCVPERLPFNLGVREWTYAICLIITVICMIIVLFVYLLCTELRNTFYGVAIKTYCLCIIIGYSLLAHLTLTDPADMTKHACSKIPLFALLYLILSFYILTFISFNFYLSFFGIILSKLMFWFVFFPIVLVTACWSFYVSFTHYNGKPVFGNDTCWFDPRNYSIVVFLYAPCMVACIFSSIFYILSLVRRSEMNEGDTAKQTIFVSRNRFNSFWKFFNYTLISWFICVCSFAINYYRADYTHINYVVCLIIAFHGFGAMYALIGKNHQIQHFLRRIDEEVDNDDMADISIPMTQYS